MRAEVTTDGSRILARIPYEEGTGAKAAKSIAGAKWHPASSTWRYPLDLGVCHELRRVFGDGLRVASPLSVWARTEMAHHAKLEALRSGDSASLQAGLLERVAEQAPKLYDAISNRGYQLNGAAFVGEAGQCILGDQPGLGKTLQTLAALTQAGSQRILVACPRTATRSVWVRETNRWAPKIMPFVAQGSPTQRAAAMQSFLEMPYGGPKMLIINTEMIRAKKQEICPKWGKRAESCTDGDDPTHKHKTITVPNWPFLVEQTWDAIVLDESHNLLASTANIQSKRITQARFGAVRLRKQLRPGGLAIACSGTPFRSRLEKGWGTLNWLRPDKFSSYWRFAETHFGVTEGQWGKHVGTEVAKGKWVAEPLDAEAFDAELRPYYLARTKADVAPDLPPIQYAGTPSLNDPDGDNAVWLEMDPKQKAAYDRMVKMADAQIDGGKILANGVLAELTRLRQLCGAYGKKAGEGTMLPVLPSSKIEWILEFLAEREGNAGKVVIASSFSKMVELTAATVRKEAGQPVLTLTGATSDKARADLVSRFADDDSLRVVAINSKAGGEAITLDAADDMIFLDLPWTSDEIEQVESRIHRISRIHNVTIYRLLIQDSVEEWIFGLTEEQKALISAARPEALAMARQALHS